MTSSTDSVGAITSPDINTENQTKGGCPKGSTKANKQETWWNTKYAVDWVTTKYNSAQVMAKKEDKK